MPYSIETKDGIRIDNIPDDVPPDSQVLKDRVAAIRANRKPADAMPQGPSTQPSMPASMVDRQSMGALAANPPQVPQTEALGAIGGATRGLGPVSAGAATGAAIGSIIPGFGTLAGAGLGAATVGGMQLLSPAVQSINQLLGTNIPDPMAAFTTLFDKLGVAKPDTEAEKLIQAVAAGAGSGASDVGLGQILAQFGGSQAVKGIGQALAAQPLGQIAGSAGAQGAQGAAAMSGAGPVGQLAAGLAGGVVGSRLAPDAVSLIAPKPQAPEAVGETVRKAAMGNVGAKAQVAAESAINPGARASAERLGFDLPVDVFSDSPQIRAAAGLGRSVVASDAESAWRTTVEGALNRADDVLQEAGAAFIEGRPAPADVSERVKSSLMATRDALSKQAKALYDEVDKSVPKETPAQFPKLSATLDEIVSEVGEEGLTSQERNLKSLVEGGGTYGRLLREKNLIGQAVNRKDSPYGNLEAGTLKRLYGALADDQLATVEAIGAQELRDKLSQANLIYGKERELGKSIVSAFGKDFQGSLADKMRSSLSGAAKGDTATYKRLVQTIPEGLKQEAVATAVASVARSRTGQFGFAEYAKFYPSIRANPEIYSDVVKTLGPQSDQLMRDLYEVSKRITDARAQVITTGKANQALLQGLVGQTLIEKIIGSAAGRSAVTAAGAGAGGLVTGGSPIGAAAGAGLSSAFVNALSKGDKQKLAAVGNLFKDRQFQDFMVKYAGAGKEVTSADIKRLATSSGFDRFAKAVKLPVRTDARENWILGAIQAEIAERSQEGK